MFRPKIYDDFWYLLSLSGKVIDERSSRPINTHPYPGVRWLAGQELRLSGRDYWEITPTAPVVPAQPAIKTVADTYQGHASDGSSVQKHSCGGLYPYVIFAQESINGIAYGVIGPKKPHGILVGTYPSAVAHAVKLKAAEK